jgi:hypothetical protein
MPITNNSDSLVTRNLTVEDALTLADSTTLEFKEMTAPVTPPNGALLVYAKSDGKLYVKNDTGAESDLTAGKQNVAKIFYIENPTATDAFPIGYVPQAATLVAVRAITDTGTVTFNIEKRAKLTPDVAGTNAWTLDKQATAAGLEQTVFGAGSIAADKWLYFAASAIASAPTKLWLSVEFTID